MPPYSFSLTPLNPSPIQPNNLSGQIRILISQVVDQIGHLLRLSKASGGNLFDQGNESSSRKRFISVSMAPHATAFTWTLLGASSLASALVKALIPPFVAE